MDLDARTRRLARLMEDRLDIRGDGFEAKLARAGRKLPKHLKRDGEALAEALRLAEHPRLGRQVDARRLRKAARRLERYLLRVDAQARRMGLVLDWLAGNAFNLIVVAALAAAVLIWRGLL